MRHEDESIVPTESAHSARCSLDSLFILKRRGFKERTRAFQFLILACVVIDAVGSAFGMPAPILLAVLLLTVLGVAAVACIRTGDLADIAATVAVRREPRRSEDDDQPFTHYS